MQQTHETFTTKIGDAIVQLPARAVVENYLRSILGETPAKANTINRDTPPPIGSQWNDQGGIYAGTMRGENGHDYHLIVANSSEGFAKDIAWGSQGKAEDGAQSDFDGLKNTFALYQSKHKHPAAEWANELNIDGHEDWYLPARRELRLCWVNVPELFEDGWYWSSTQSSADFAWYQVFDDGFQNSGGKGVEGRARAVRRLLVIQ